MAFCRLCTLDIYLFFVLNHLLPNISQPLKVGTYVLTNQPTCKIRLHHRLVLHVLKLKDLGVFFWRVWGGSRESFWGVAGALGGESPVEEPPPRRPRRRLFGRSRRSGSGIRVGGQSDVMARIARCCAPLPGDDVTGFVTRGRGVTVHRADCRKIFEVDRERRIDVEWEPDVDVPHRIRMRVRSRDKTGLLAKVTRIISSRGINIGSARASTNAERLAEQTFDVWVNDVATLNAAMREIRRLRGVISVERLGG